MNHFFPYLSILYKNYQLITTSLAHRQNHISDNHSQIIIIKRVHQSTLQFLLKEFFCISFFIPFI